MNARTYPFPIGTIADAITIGAGVAQVEFCVHWTCERPVERFSARMTGRFLVEGESLDDNRGEVISRLDFIPGDPWVHQIAVARFGPVPEDARLFIYEIDSRPMLLPGVLYLCRPDLVVYSRTRDEAFVQGREIVPTGMLVPIRGL